MTLNWSLTLEVNETLNSTTVHVEIGDMDFYLHLVDNEQDGLEEVQITSTRKDSDMRSLLSAVCELINLCLLHHIPLREITNRLEFIRGETAGFTNNSIVRSAASLIDFVAKYIVRKYLEEPNGESIHAPEEHP